MHMYKLLCLNKIILFLSSVIGVRAQYGSECILPNQQNGICVPIKSCKTTYELLLNIQRTSTTVSASDRENLLKLQCGTLKHGPLVCCLKSKLQLNVDGLDILKNTTCGVYSPNRVANGQVAVLSGFPWMVLLKYNDELTPFKCGGSLISDRYVLTAAHCITATKKQLIAARLGEHRISTERDCANLTRKIICAPPVEDVGIEEILLHENYEKTLYHDIALLRLNRTVDFQKHIKPLCLPIFDNLRANNYNQYVISGWGATENRSFSDVLIVAVVSSVERSQCQSTLGIRLPLTEGQMCAGGLNAVDTCRGDSGGPLGFKDFYDGHPRFIQFGIVSFGLNNCGSESPPTVYTNISYYLQWVTDHMW